MILVIIMVSKGGIDTGTSHEEDVDDYWKEITCGTATKFWY